MCELGLCVQYSIRYDTYTSSQLCVLQIANTYHTLIPKKKKDLDLYNLHVVTSAHQTCGFVKDLSVYKLLESIHRNSLFPCTEGQQEVAGLTGSRERDSDRTQTQRLFGYIFMPLSCK